MLDYSWVLELENINIGFFLAKRVISLGREDDERVECGSARKCFLSPKNSARSRCGLVVPWQEMSLSLSLCQWKDGARIKAQGLKVPPTLLHTPFQIPPALP